jgi:beta-glucanase (GH16 family)
MPGFSFKYGYVEARMKLNKGSGLWPAFWMMPTPDANGNYHDGDGEIDIMEQVGTDPTRTEAHLHHNGTSGKSFDTGLDLSAGFHTYGLDWQADHMTWYFDGKPFYTVTANVPNVAEYLIFNLAVGDANSWPGAPDANAVFPATMQVDYVHVYQLASGSTVTPMSGDANGDGKVDVGDLGVVGTNYGMTSGATWAMGDFNADGKVDVADMGVLATNYGKTGGPITGLSTMTGAAATPLVASTMQVAATPQATVASPTFASSATAASNSASTTVSMAASPTVSKVDSAFSNVPIRD